MVCIFAQRHHAVGRSIIDRAHLELVPDIFEDGKWPLCLRTGKQELLLAVRWLALNVLRKYVANRLAGESINGQGMCVNTCVVCVQILYTQSRHLLGFPFLWTRIHRLALEEGKRMVREEARTWPSVRKGLKFYTAGSGSFKAMYFRGTEKSG